MDRSAASAVIPEKNPDIAEMSRGARKISLSRRVTPHRGRHRGPCPGGQGQSGADGYTGTEGRGGAEGGVGGAAATTGT
jgi:hypothetical protein